MNRIERWWLRRLLAREVRQGYSHDLRISTLYGEIRRAVEHEFTEDNEATRDAYLREWFEATQSAPQ